MKTSMKTKAVSAVKSSAYPPVDLVDRLEPPTQIIERLTGTTPSRKTVSRFVLRGIGGEILRSVLLGNRRLSCERWTRDWMAKLTAKRARELSKKSA